VEEMRSAWVLGVALVLALVSTATAVEDPHGIGYDGHDWKAMPEQAKLAYIAGFLAGTAMEQAVAIHRANPKISIDAAVSEIVRAHTGTFPFGVNVYKNDLDDYYFYRNNLPIRIYRALLDENAHMLKGPGGGKGPDSP
jgi:hypothetical protein